MIAPVSSMEPLLVPAWNDLSWLVHGFSTRQGGVSTVYSASRQVPGLLSNATSEDRDVTGDLNLGFTVADSAENVRTNRERYTAYLTGGASASLITLRQTHSAITHRVSEQDACPPGPAAVLAGDGLMTTCAGVLLGIQTADCVPILLVDTQHRAVAAFHAGWRGTVARIVEQGVQRMKQEFGSNPHDLRAAIGPAIGACCYIVGEEVRRQFQQAFPYAEQLLQSEGGASLRLDLAEANRRQLLAAGLLEQNINLLGCCTQCEPRRFFSHRGQSGFTGRMLAVIGLR